MRLLGLDVGERRIGLAVSDPTGLLASPHGVIEVRGRARDAERVAAVAREVEAAGIVVGLPRQMDGAEGAQAEQVRRFMRELRRHLDLPVTWIDERLSTVAANRSLRDAGVRGSRRRETIDAVAAAVILQSHLDHRRRHPTPAPPGDPVDPDRGR